jgi:hypothetical protein
MRAVSPKSRYLLINQKQTPTSLTRAKSPKFQDASVAASGFEQLFTGSLDEDDATVKSNLTEDTTFFGALNAKKIQDKTSGSQIQPWMLLDPIFFLERARLDFLKEAKVGTVRSKPLPPVKPSLLDDESLKSSDVKTIFTENSNASSDLSTGSRFLLTCKCLPRKRTMLIPVVPNQKEFQKWKQVGSKVNYPGRPSTNMG